MLPYFIFQQRQQRRSFTPQQYFSILPSQNPFTTNATLSLKKPFHNVITSFANLNNFVQKNYCIGSQNWDLTKQHCIVFSNILQSYTIFEEINKKPNSNMPLKKLPKLRTSFFSLWQPKCYFCIIIPACSTIFEDYCSSG